VRNICLFLSKPDYSKQKFFQDQTKPVAMQGRKATDIIDLSCYARRVAIFDDYPTSLFSQVDYIPKKRPAPAYGETSRPRKFPDFRVTSLEANSYQLK
jgi:hypothetical protein